MDPNAFDTNALSDAAFLFFPDIPPAPAAGGYRLRRKSSGGQ